MWKVSFIHVGMPGCESVYLDLSVNQRDKVNILFIYLSVPVM